MFTGSRLVPKHKFALATGSVLEVAVCIAGLWGVGGKAVG